MSAIFEGRQSDSPYVQVIWRGRVLHDYNPVCPADANWNLLFVKHKGTVTTLLEGPTTQSVSKINHEGAEFLVIKFNLGVYMPHLPASDYVNGLTPLPHSRRGAFWLQGSAMELPDFENVEAFADKLVREGTLVYDPVVQAALQGQHKDVSHRTVRRRFLQATGVTQGTIHQIARAKQAAALLGQGASILDTVDQAGYADQPHLTRSLKRYFGQTPAQLVRASAE